MERWTERQSDGQRDRHAENRQTDRKLTHRSYVLEPKKLVNSLKRRTTDRPSAGEAVYLTSDRPIDCDLIND